MLLWIPILLSSLQFSNSATQNHFESGYRLPKNIIPLRYKLRLGFHETRYCQWHEGNVEIDIFCVTETSTLILHFHDLNYIRHSLKCETQKNLTLMNPRLDPVKQIITFDFGPESGSTIMPGERCKVTLVNQWRRQGNPAQGHMGAYGGRVNEFYLSTLFSKTGARMVFPCFDEPAFKAVFQLNMRLDKKLSAQVRVTHNTALVEKKMAFGIETWIFEDTPKMSTYLLAIVISNVTVPRVVYTRSTPPWIETIGMKSNEVLYEAAYLTRETNDLFAELFQFPNPIKKISYISENPSDKSAMENWGLVIGDFDHAVHEIVHSWFGNLVTNDFWDDIWLNEGLTHFYTGIACDLLPVQMNLTGKFIYFNTELWMKAIGLGQLRNWSLSGDHFIARDAYYYYAVGPAILRMVEGIMGFDNMLLATRRYLKAYAFKTAKTSDYLSILDQVSNELNIPGWIPGQALSFTDLLTHWIYTVRFPVVVISESENHYVLRQECIPGHDPCTTDWTIPIWWSNTETLNVSGPVWLLPGQEVKLPVPREGKIIWDPEIRSYYMINKTYETPENIESDLAEDLSNRIPDLLHSTSFGNDLFNNHKVKAILKKIGQTDSEKMWRIAGIVIKQAHRFLEGSSYEHQKDFTESLLENYDCSDEESNSQKRQIVNIVMKGLRVYSKPPCSND